VGVHGKQGWREKGIKDDAGGWDFGHAADDRPVTLPIMGALIVDRKL